MAELVIAAYWAADGTKLPDLEGHGYPGSGAVVSLAAKNVDGELRHILRRLHIEEAADWEPEAA